MNEIWYAIAAFMLTAYVVLDGFDFGAGALHLFVARTDTERFAEEFSSLADRMRPEETRA